MRALQPCFPPLLLRVVGINATAGTSTTTVTAKAAPTTAGIKKLQNQHFLAFVTLCNTFAHCRRTAEVLSTYSRDEKVHFCTKWHSLGLLSRMGVCCGNKLFCYSNATEVLQKGRRSTPEVPPKSNRNEKVHFCTKCCSLGLLSRMGVYYGNELFCYRSPAEVLQKGCRSATEGPPKYHSPLSGEGCQGRPSTTSPAEVPQ